MTYILIAIFGYWLLYWSLGALEIMGLVLQLWKRSRGKYSRGFSSGLVGGQHPERGWGGSPQTTTEHFISLSSLFLMYLCPLFF